MKQLAKSKNYKLSQIKFLSSEEISKLIAGITEKRDKAIFVIGYRHALRSSEIGLLRVEDIDLKSYRIHLTRLKGSLNGIHPLQLDELKIMRAYLKERARSPYAGSPYLFLSKKGLPISRRMLDLLMKEYCNRAGVAPDKAHFHTLKHSIATHLLDAGTELRKVQDWLGHANIQSTIIYTHISTSSRDQLAREIFKKLPKFS